jgi:hypothetical protein
MSGNVPYEIFYELPPEDGDERYNPAPGSDGMTREVAAWESSGQRPLGQVSVPNNPKPIKNVILPGGEDPIL